MIVLTSLIVTSHLTIRVHGSTDICDALGGVRLAVEGPCVPREFTQLFNETTLQSNETIQTRLVEEANMSDLVITNTSAIVQQKSESFNQGRNDTLEKIGNTEFSVSLEPSEVIKDRAETFSITGTLKQGNITDNLEGKTIIVEIKNSDEELVISGLSASTTDEGKYTMQKDLHTLQEGKHTIFAKHTGNLGKIFKQTQNSKLREIGLQQ